MRLEGGCPPPIDAIRCEALQRLPAALRVRAGHQPGCKASRGPASTQLSGSTQASLHHSRLSGLPLGCPTCWHSGHAALPFFCREGSDHCPHSGNSHPASGCHLGEALPVSTITIPSKISQLSTSFVALIFFVGFFCFLFFFFFFFFWWSFGIW